MALERHKLGEVGEDRGLEFQTVVDRFWVSILNVGDDLQEPDMADNHPQHRLDDRLLIADVDEVVISQDQNKDENIDNPDSCIQLSSAPRRTLFALHQL